MHPPRYVMELVNCMEIIQEIKRTIISLSSSEQNVDSLIDLN